MRQVFYRLVGRHGYDKTEHAYARLGEALNRARRAGLVPFGAIRDDGAARVEAHHWAGPEAFQADVARWARGFRLDRQGGQHRRLWLLCEAAGMAPMLARAADPYGVPVLSSGGFDSLTAKHALARELATCDAPAAEVLHVGDLDPSGEHLFASLAEDVGAMAAALGGAAPRFSRLCRDLGAGGGAWAAHRAAQAHRPPLVLGRGHGAGRGHRARRAERAGA